MRAPISGFWHNGHGRDLWRQSGWRGESPAERVRVTLEVLATELEGITLALDDSDALVRLDASSRYDALQDQLESVPEMVNNPDALTYH